MIQWRGGGGVKCPKYLHVTAHLETHTYTHTHTKKRKKNASQPLQTVPSAANNTPSFGSGSTYNTYYILFL